MLSELINRLTQPAERPLLQVSLYYLGLGALVALALSVFPDLGPVLDRGQDWFASGSDVFEPVASGADESALGSPVELLASLLGAVLLMMPVSWVYMSTRIRTGFDQSVVQTMIILPIAVAGIVTIVSNSLALAFSLAGIVAGVRFRNALKDTSDALYIFAAIGVGLACGIGSLTSAAIVSIFFNYTILVLWRCAYGTCPKGGAKLEYAAASGLSLKGLEIPAPPEGPGGAKAKKKGKKRKKKNKGAPGAPAFDAASGPSREALPVPAAAASGHEPPEPGREGAT